MKIDPSNPLFLHWDHETWVPLLGLRHGLGEIVIHLHFSFLGSLMCLMLIMLLRVVLRKTFLAVGAFAVLMVIFREEQITAPVHLIAISIHVISGTWLLARFGMVSCMAWMIVANLLTYPITLDPSRWHFGSGILLLLPILVLSLYGFMVAIAGPSALRGLFAAPDPRRS